MRPVVHNNSAAGKLLFGIPWPLHIHITAEHEAKIQDLSETLFFKQFLRFQDLIKKPELESGQKKQALFLRLCGHFPCFGRRDGKRFFAKNIYSLIQEIQNYLLMRRGNSADAYSV